MRAALLHTMALTVLTIPEPIGRNRYFAILASSK